MQNIAMAIAGLVILAGTVFTIYRLAPREGSMTVAWMQRENIATIVTLALMVLGLTGIGLIVKALA